MTYQFKCNSQSRYKQLAYEKKLFKHDKSPFGAVSDPGGESGGCGPPLPIPGACLRLKCLHRQDLTSLFNWLIF